jgi:hypothetical protein
MGGLIMCDENYIEDITLEELIDSLLSISKSRGRYNVTCNNEYKITKEIVINDDLKKIDLGGAFENV